MGASSKSGSRSSWWAQATHNKLIAMVLAMIVVVPLVAVPANLVMRGLVTLIFEAFAVLLATMLLWNGQIDLRREKVQAFIRTGPNVPVVALTIWSLIRGYPLTVYGVQGVLQLAAGILLYFIVGYQFRQSKHLSMLVDVLMFLAVALTCAVAAQYLITPEARGTALFGNQQPLGSMLMILLPVVASVAIADKSANRQILAQAATVLILGSLLLAQTRSAWLGAALGLVIVGIFAVSTAVANRKLDAKGNRGYSKHKLVFPAILVVVALGFGAAVVSQNSSIVERGATLSKIKNIKSFQARVNLWNGAWAMIKERPVLGWGTGMYPVHQYKFTGSGQPITNTSGEVSLASQAHNFYLQTGAEIGLPGLVLWLIVLLTFIATASMRIPKMDGGIRRTLLIASVGSVVAFSVDALSSPSWQFGQISIFLWLIMGIGISCMRPKTAKYEE